MKNIREHFEKHDPVMAGLLEKHGIPKSRRLVKNKFEYLVLTILYQQLATKAADTIAERFRSLFSPKGANNKRGFGIFPTPLEILKTSDATLRTAGVSYQKSNYIKDLAEKVSSKIVELEKLEKLQDEEVILELTKVKGIGRWTAEMFLMSALARPDVFSLGDFGLRNGVKFAYGFKTTPSDRTLLRLSKKWSPYRTTASRLLWKTTNLK